MRKQGNVFSTRSRSRWRSRRGLTIIEMLCALAVFCVCFFVIIEAWPVSKRSVQQGKNILLASHLGEQAMEGAIAEGYDDVTPSVSVYPLTSVMDGVTQTIDMTVRIVVTEPITDLKDVRVLVEWQEGARARHVEFESFVANTEQE